MTVAEQLEAERKNDIKVIMQTENGRRFLWRLLSQCGVYQDVNTETESETHRRLGQRSIGLWTLQLISEVDDSKVFNMMKEAKAHDRHYNTLYDNEAKKINPIKGIDDLL